MSADKNKLFNEKHAFHEPQKERIVQSDEEFEWYCHYCGEFNAVWLDLTITGKQDFIEDCSVCCRPNRIILTSDYDRNFFLDVRQLDE